MEGVMGDNVAGLALDAVAIGISLVSLSVSGWIAFRINKQQLAASSQMTFAQATAEHFDRICDRFARLQEEANKVVEIAVRIEKDQGVSTAGDLTGYVTQSNAAAVSATQLSTELQVLQENFELHANIIGFERDKPAAIARIMDLVTIAQEAVEKLNFPPTLSTLSNQMIAGTSTWDNEWSRATADWAKGALELKIRSINARSAMNKEFRAFTDFALKQENSLAKAAKTK
jgi:hypothetical protein